MNSFFALLGIESWKPVVSALLLPPVPLLLMVLVGARLMLPRRGLGWLVIILATVLLWLSACTGAAQALSQLLLHPPAAMSFDRIKELKAEVQARHPIAIVVLGGGVEPFAPEYGVSSLRGASLERLRYGVWLGRETGIPVAFSGGLGYAQGGDAMPEAQVAAKIAAQDFGRPLKWVEDNSRDTRQNAARSVALLKPLGITRIVVVTNGWHMPRAQRAFAEVAGPGLQIEAAPMGLAKGIQQASLVWLPSAAGFSEMQSVLHEVIGMIVGA